MGGTEAVNEKHKKDLVQVAPGLWVTPAAREAAQKRLQHRRLLLLDEEGYADLGLTPRNVKTMFRLHECGMIKLYRIAPRTALLDVDSWNAHMERVQNDPWYWEDERNLHSYRGTYAD